MYSNAQEVLSAINNAANVGEIVSILEDANLDGVVMDAADLRTVALQQSTMLSGNAPVILYSGAAGAVVGQLPGGGDKLEVSTQNVAKNLAANTDSAGNNKYKIILDTDAGKLADSAQMELIPFEQTPFYKHLELCEKGMLGEKECEKIYHAKEHGMQQWKIQK